MDYIYNNIGEHNSGKEFKISIAFHDMFADILSSGKLNPIVTELFIRNVKLNISLIFILNFYFAVPKILD